MVEAAAAKDARKTRRAAASAPFFSRAGHLYEVLFMLAPVLEALTVRPPSHYLSRVISCIYRQARVAFHEDALERLPSA
jgi:hypothetical protein